MSCYLKGQILHSLLLCLKIAHLQVGSRSPKITEVNIEVLTFINQNVNLFAQHEKCSWISLGDISAGMCQQHPKKMCLNPAATAGPHIGRDHAVQTAMQFIFDVKVQRQITAACIK